MIILEPDKCSGCTRCEVNCSFFHSGKVGRSGARIKVVKVEETGIDYPVVCQHCQERYCTDCPEDGIEIGPLGQVIVSPELCTACGVCEIMCPIGAIEVYEDVPYVCDLCDGNPHCVAACTMNAIHFDPELSGKVSLEPFSKNADELDAEEKRIRYATQSMRELRGRWISEREV